jgi:hypothetical protein
VNGFSGPSELATPRMNHQSTLILPDFLLRQDFL